MASNGHVLCAGNWTKIDNCQPHFDFHARRWIFCFLSAGSRSCQALNANARGAYFFTWNVSHAETMQGWQKSYPGLRNALMQNPRKRIKSLQLSCQAANSSWETTFSAPFAPRIFLTEKPWGRGSRKDALLRCDTHDMRRLLRRYLICFCLFQSRIFSGNVFPTDEERAGNTHSSDSCISLVSRQWAVYAWLP